MQKEELAYWAGFFDYEAGIYFYKSHYIKKGRERIEYKCRIEGISHMEIVVDTLKAAWGGCMRKRKDRFIWWICGQRAGDMIKNILPYIKIKKEEAQMILDFCSTIYPQDGNPISEDIVEIRESLIKRSHDLHRYYSKRPL